MYHCTVVDYSLMQHSQYLTDASPVPQWLLSSLAPPLLPERVWVSEATRRRLVKKLGQKLLSTNQPSRTASLVDRSAITGMSPAISRRSRALRLSLKHSSQISISPPSNLSGTEIALCNVARLAWAAAADPAALPYPSQSDNRPRKLRHKTIPLLTPLVITLPLCDLRSRCQTTSTLLCVA